MGADAKKRYLERGSREVGCSFQLFSYQRGAHFPPRGYSIWTSRGVGLHELYAIAGKHFDKATLRRLDPQTYPVQVATRYRSIEAMQLSILNCIP